MAQRIRVLVATPAHSRLHGPLTYLSEGPLADGTLVRVPLGSRETLGIVWREQDGLQTDDFVHEPRPVTAVLDAVAPLPKSWCDLIAFAARYYQRAAGEVALAALPPQLRQIDAIQLARRLQRAARHAPSTVTSAASAAPSAPEAPVLTDAQARALDAIDHAAPGAPPLLLFGATGSGKTEVYLRAVQQMLERTPDGQALVLVPEINLTPQLQARFTERFAARFGDAAVVSLHSGMTDAQRLRGWLAAHTGQARIVLGTRLAVFASLPALQLIVVDEEHDPSYKQQDGARHSARDLAVYRGHLQKVRVVLGSATPSLESWQASERGRYTRLEMPARIGQAQLPRVRVVDMNREPPRTLISSALLAAIAERIARGEQSLIFLNRRGYAPVLSCHSCGWQSECSHCSAFRVFHKLDRTLRCHHCGFTSRVPRACPSCGDPDIVPQGRGTEQLEEQIAALVGQLPSARGGTARVLRMDADSTRLKGALEQQLSQVHAGDIDVLVGTQMITKGHDFRHITLVAAVQPDAALFSSDFRAAERLFALLMQAAGRAGRDASRGSSEMWIQTWHPAHPLFDALRRHDYPGFAALQLREREQASLPPFAYQALLRAEARTQDGAQAFLRDAAAQAPALPGAGEVTLYGAVPMTVQRVANVERAQLLLESTSRAALQAFLSAWQPALRSLRTPGLIRWAIDVDPLSI